MKTFSTRVARRVFAAIATTVALSLVFWACEKKFSEPESMPPSVQRGIFVKERNSESQSQPLIENRLSVDEDLNKLFDEVSEILIHSFEHTNSLSPEARKKMLLGISKLQNETSFEQEERVFSKVCQGKNPLT